MRGPVLRPAIPWDELLKIPPSPLAEWIRRQFPVPPEPPAGAPRIGLADGKAIVTKS